MRGADSGGPLRSDELYANERDLRFRMFPTRRIFLYCKIPAW